MFGELLLLLLLLPLRSVSAAAREDGEGEVELGLWGRRACESFVAWGPGQLDRGDCSSRCGDACRCPKMASGESGLVMLRAFCLAGCGEERRGDAFRDASSFGMTASRQRVGTGDQERICGDGCRGVGGEACEGISGGREGDKSLADFLKTVSSGGRVAMRQSCGVDTRCS